MKSKFSYFVTILFSFILGGLAMYYFSYMHPVKVIDNGDGTKTSVPVQATCKSCNSTVIVENGSLSAAVEKGYNATVMVKVSKNQKTGGGSGFIYRISGNDAYIITNHHVVDGGTKFSVVTSNDEELEAKVLGSDEYLDIAVIKVPKKDYMEVVSIADKDKKISLGDTVFAIGSPVDYEYRGTVTNGIVSGLNRLVEVSVKNSLKGDYVMEVIQTNTAVNPGNSGGPLFNANGEVIGVISMKLVDSSVEGMGFAIPIHFAMSHIEKLENGEKIERPLLGISLLDISDSYYLWQNKIIIPEGVEKGVVVMEIAEKSGASNSDLKKGDIIVKINGLEVKNSAYLKYLLYKYNPGDTVKITYNRSGKEYNTNIKLTKNEE